MDELLLRLALIAGALAVAALATIVIRSRASGRPRSITDTDLDPGVYLFSSSACQDCGRARRALGEALGEGGFNELNWEQDPGVFHRLGVDAVPATMIVDREGSGTIWEGSAEDAIAALGP